MIVDEDHTTIKGFQRNIHKLEAWGEAEGREGKGGGKEQATQRAMEMFKVQHQQSRRRQEQHLTTTYCYYKVNLRPKHAVHIVKVRVLCLLTLV